MGMYSVVDSLAVWQLSDVAVICLTRLFLDMRPALLMTGKRKGMQCRPKGNITTSVMGCPPPRCAGVDTESSNITVDMLRVGDMIDVGLMLLYVGEAGSAPRGPPNVVVFKTDNGWRPTMR